MKNNISKLKIALILKKNGREKYLYPSVKKTQIFLRNEAEQYLKSGYLITIRVNYGTSINVFGKETVFMNAGTYNLVDDLRWAYTAFIKDYLHPDHD